MNQIGDREGAPDDKNARRLGRAWVWAWVWAWVSG